MYSGLLIVIVPLLIGYLFPLRQPTLTPWIGKLCGWMVYVILGLMGITLSYLDNLSANLQHIVLNALVFFGCINLLNLIALYVVDKCWPWQVTLHQQVLPSRLKMAADSLQLLGVVFVGFAVGWVTQPWSVYAGKASEYALIFLLWLIGIQLRNSNMPLRQILLNRRGMLIAVVVLISSLLGGLIAALLLGLPLNKGLAIASGFGWYSLSGIMLTDALGPVLGSAAFFNDLLRELVAIMIIPLLVRRYSMSAVGIGGATAMDFTLPVIQKSGSVQLVPAAIVSGFILSLSAPVFMALFAL
ncbi:MAG: lysine exporter LysO family protein [Plesiomonas sp.]|uniref:lysine exporter LysO family protein n=1 Tax=Plesiomonas sp. TaxID=2486279 RepID=UPI003F359621